MIDLIEIIDEKIDSNNEAIRSTQAILLGLKEQNAKLTREVSKHITKLKFLRGHPIMNRKLKTQGETVQYGVQKKKVARHTKKGKI